MTPWLVVCHLLSDLSPWVILWQTASLGKDGGATERMWDCKVLPSVLPDTLTVSPTVYETEQVPQKVGSQERRITLLPELSLPQPWALVTIQQASNVYGYLGGVVLRRQRRNFGIRQSAPLRKSSLEKETRESTMKTSPAPGEKTGSASRPGEGLAPTQLWLVSQTKAGGPRVLGRMEMMVQVSDEQRLGTDSSWGSRKLPRRFTRLPTEEEPAHQVQGNWTVPKALVKNHSRSEAGCVWSDFPSKILPLK